VDPGAQAWRVLDDGIEAPATSAAPAPPAASSRRVVSMVALGVAATLAVAAFAVAATASGGSVEVDGGTPVDAASAAAGGSSPETGTGVLLVDVQGAVAHPGVVRLVIGSRVGDAIAAAGGYGPRVDPARVGQVLNLAAPLHDGDQVVVPSRDDPPSGGGTGSGGAAGVGTGGAGGSGGGSPGVPVDLNRATAAELDALPGIGPVTAAKIIAARDEKPFASVDDLRTRKLVGPSTFDKIKALVTVG
jgi:competence protein ComEA